MSLEFGREICGSLTTLELREWLVTNGIGGYAAGTVAGLTTRRYHGLLIAALKPPLERTLLLAKLDEVAQYDERYYPLYANRWSDGKVDPHGYIHIERFYLDGTTPLWQFACADAVLEKRIWMQHGANTTYVQYRLTRATQPLTLTLKALVNYRDHHGDTQANNWQMSVEPIDRGIQAIAYAGAVPFYLLGNSGNFTSEHNWYYGFDLSVERYRGLSDREDRLHAATFTTTLQPGESFTIVATTDKLSNLDGDSALQQQRERERELISLWENSQHGDPATTPAWIEHLVLAADGFIVNRKVKPERSSLSSSEPDGKTIVAGYPWFSDWGRDTMIALPGLTLSVGRPDVARSILRTFARYVHQGMLPNRFPDVGELPEYNTVDATLWYFEAIRAYYSYTRDEVLLNELFPILAAIVKWHCRGTRYNIHLDRSDGLLYAGEIGVQLTWMDAKIGDWVVTPRTGKPVEVNALWYNALRTMTQFARQLGKPEQEYETLAEQVSNSFSRFWSESKGYCYDVLDSPTGDDITLRPNQIFAVSLPESPLSPAQQKKVVDACGRALLTSHGLRSLSPDYPQYRGRYGGNPLQRDSAYHQGTTWGWLIGAFVLAHLRVYGDPDRARQFLEPMAHHLSDAGIGNLSEIFDGDAPMTPRGCIAQAWTVAEVLRAWVATERSQAESKMGNP